MNHHSVDEGDAERIDRRRFVRSLALLPPGIVGGLTLAAAGASCAAPPRENRSAANQRTVKAAERRDIIVHRDRFAYCSHACIVRLSNGEWIVVFNECQRRERYTHPPSDPHFHNLLTRSTDEGRNWSTPQAVPGWEWYGVECPGVAELRDGTVVLNQWQFLWYPLAVGRRLAAEGKEIWLDTGNGFRVADPDADWSRSRFPWARANGGCYVHLSSDGARTWDRTVKIDTAPAATFSLSVRYHADAAHQRIAGSGR